MPELSTYLRRALRPHVPLYMAGHYWSVIGNLHVTLLASPCTVAAELVVSFALTGVAGCEVLARLVDLDGDAAGAEWFDAHAEDLTCLYDEWMAARPTSAEVAA
jgi:hypothetical protein